MGDMGDAFKDYDAFMRERKDRLAVDCPSCKQRFPKAHPKRLMPGQKCFCGYRDMREDEP